MRGNVKPVSVAAMGCDHRHIYGMLQGMLDAGAHASCWWTERETNVLDGFERRFPSIQRVADRRSILEDQSIDMVLIASIPSERADLAIEAMEHGKDVMVDKPGCTTLADIDRIRAAVVRTGRIWSVNFSERFEVPAVTRALELVGEGAIGRVIQTVGLGPHRHNAHMRPDWFYEPALSGGILCDIGSHQIDQFMVFTGSKEVEILSATSRNHANPAHPRFEDYGEILLRGDKGHGFIRVDWYTPDALPTWGDGRLILLGTEGTIELRKYVDVAGRPGTDHLLLTNGSRCEYIDASQAGMPYFARLLADILNRTETAMAQEHAFKVMALAIAAQNRVREYQL
jgi:predicted dehydrogenase